MGHGLPSYQVDTKTISRRISILLNPAAFVASDHGANGAWGMGQASKLSS